MYARHGILVVVISEFQVVRAGCVEGLLQVPGVRHGAGSCRFERLAGVNCELELELIQTQMAQKPMLRAEVGMRVRCANKASAE